MKLVQYHALQDALQDTSERVRAAVAASQELQALQRSCTNAWNLYCRTRPAASPESAARARGMPVPGVHPLLAAAAPQSAVDAPDIQVKTVSFKDSMCVSDLAIIECKQDCSNYPTMFT